LLDKVYLFVLRYFFKFISFVFHPLFVLTYMLVLLTLLNPYLFSVKTLSENYKLILAIFLSTFFLPAFAIGLLKPLGFITSLEMPTNKERIGPLIITSIFYFWIFITIKNNNDIPPAFKVCVLGSSIALAIGFLINVFQKISLHAIGMGGLLAMVMISMWLFSYGYFDINPYQDVLLQISIETILFAIIIISGLVCTGRLYLKSHTIYEIVGGFFIGFITQFIALKILIL
jgi:hypothetical protein